MNHNQQSNLSKPEVQKILKRPQTSKSKQIYYQSLEEQSVTDTTTVTPQPIVTIPPQYSSAGEFNEIRTELEDDFRADYDESDYWD